MFKLPKVFVILMLVLALSGIAYTNAFAWTAEEINKDVEISLKSFKRIGGAPDILNRAAGVLVFPSVFKGGFGIGGEYGEGALLINNKTVAYYNTAAASIGFQLGGQKKTIIIAFMTKDALEKFQNSYGWKAGVDASIAVIAIGAGGSIDTAKANEPIIAFVMDQKGLMYNVTLEGAKISKIEK